MDSELPFCTQSGFMLAREAGLMSTAEGLGNVVASARALDAIGTFLTDGFRTTTRSAI
jgi:hypothetical protein